MFRYVSCNVLHFGDLYWMTLTSKQRKNDHIPTRYPVKTLPSSGSISLEQFGCIMHVSPIFILQLELYKRLHFMWASAGAITSRPPQFFRTGQPHLTITIRK